MIYFLNFSKEARKALQKIHEPNYSKIKTAILSLENNPRPHGYLKLKSRSGYRIRVGNYGVIYDIFDSELVVEVIEVGDRKDVYKD